MPMGIAALNLRGPTHPAVLNKSISVGASSLAMLLHGNDRKQASSYKSTRLTANAAAATSAQGRPPPVHGHAREPLATVRSTPVADPDCCPSGIPARPRGFWRSPLQ